METGVVLSELKEKVYTISARAFGFTDIALLNPFESETLFTVEIVETDSGVTMAKSGGYEFIGPKCLRPSKYLTIREMAPKLVYESDKNDLEYDIDVDLPAGFTLESLKDLEVEITSDNFSIKSDSVVEKITTIKDGGFRVSTLLPFKESGQMTYSVRLLNKEDKDLFAHQEGILYKLETEKPVEGPMIIEGNAPT
eukprot:Platyproteum_vivax@DN15178_c0_g1_i1.p1